MGLGDPVPGDIMGLGTQPLKVVDLCFHRWFQYLQNGLFPNGCDYDFLNLWVGKWVCEKVPGETDLHIFEKLVN